MSRNVKAPVIIAPRKMELRTYPMPEPGARAAVVRRELCGICGTDKHTYMGYTVQYAGTDHERNLSFPIIPGHEIVGKIESIGKQSGGHLTDLVGKP